MPFLLLPAPPLRPRRVACHRALRVIVLLVLELLSLVPVHAGESASLSLEEALRLASDRSPQLAAQRSALNAAEEVTVSARQLPDPKAILGVDNLPVTGPDSFSLTRDFMTMRKIGVMQDFPRAEKRELRGQLAERVASREQAVLVDAHAALRREVASAWVDRYFAERMGTVVDEQIAEVQLQSEAMRAGLKTGKTQPGELLAVQVGLQTLLDRRAELDKQAARATAMLSRWLGDIARRPLAQYDPRAVPPDQETLGEHIAHHPHVQSLERQVDVARTEADLARASAKPDWSLELAYQQRGPTFSNMVSVQVSIDLPLFQARRQTREISAKLALVEQARALREDAIRQHLAEAQAAWSDWDAAGRRLKRFDESLLPLSQQRTRAALAAYRGGRGDLAAVLLARRDELDIKLQKLQLTAEQARAYAQLLYFLPAGDHP
jgi:outer membrane protein TolC